MFYSIGLIALIAIGTYKALSVSYETRTSTVKEVEALIARGLNIKLFSYYVKDGKIYGKVNNQRQLDSMLMVYDISNKDGQDEN